MIHRPYSLVGPGQALAQFAIPGSLEGSGAPKDAGVCETPDGRLAKPPGGTLCEGVPSFR